MDPRFVPDDPRFVADDSPAPAAPAKPAPGTAMDTAADAAVGLGTGLAFDFDDEFVGALAKVKNFAKYVPVIGPALETAGSLAQAGTGQDTYTGARDAYRARKRLASERSPVANTAGQIAGGVASSAATGGGGGILRAGAKLAAEGAVQGLGASESEDVAGLAEDAGKGALTTLAVGGALHAGGTVAGKMARGVGNLGKRLLAGAERSEVSAAGLSPRMVEKSVPGGVRAQAARQRAQGIGGLFAGKETILEQATEAATKAESARDALAKEFAQNGVTVHGGLIGTALRRKAAALDPFADEARIAALKKFADMYEKAGQMSFDAVNRSRAAWTKKINPASEAEKALIQGEVRDTLNEALEASANAHGPGLGSKWRALGQDQAAAIRAEQGAEAALGREASNRVLSPSDQGMAVVGMLKGGPKGALVAAGANRLFRGKERSAYAAAQRAMSGPATALGRPFGVAGDALLKATPAMSSAVGRAVAAGRVRVQSAARKSAEEEAKEHFLESMTNPDYRQASLEAGNGG